MLTYGGLPLVEPTPELAAMVGQTVPTTDIFEFPGHSTPWRWEGQAPLPSVEVGRLWWPRGASRFAVGHFLADDRTLGQLRNLSYSGAGTIRPLELLMRDESGTEVRTNLYLLPPRPLFTNKRSSISESDLWLLTLVDQRYFWWEASSAITVTEGTTTWAQLISSIGTALGVTITTDTIPSAYLKPSASLASQYGDLPPLLDSVLAQVGMRLVRRLDGTLWAQTPRTAKTIQDTQFNVYLARKWGGGRFAYSPGEGQHDIPSLAPTQLTAIFPRTDSGVPSSSVYTVTKTLTSLALSEYSGQAGHSGTQKIHLTTAANYTGGGTPANATELGTLATQLATDHYLWLLARLDVQFDGMVPWYTEGMSDQVVWRYRPGSCSTRIIQGHPSARDDARFISGTAGSVGLPGPVGPPGPTGATGPPGTSGISTGSGPPSAAPPFGVLFWVDISSGLIYWWNGTSWVLLVGYSSRIVRLADSATGTTMDGQSVAVGDRVLVYGPGSGAGIWVYLGSSVFARPSDAATSAQVPPGTLVTVYDGTKYHDCGFILAVPDSLTYTMGSTSQEWYKAFPTTWEANNDGIYKRRSHVSIEAGSGISVTLSDSSTGGDPTDGRTRYTIATSGGGAVPAFSGCRLTRSATQAITTGTDTAVTFTVEDYDQGGYHAANADNATVPTGKGGYYSITGTLHLALGSGVSAFAWLDVNGTSVCQSGGIPNNTDSKAEVDFVLATDYFLADGDVVKLKVRHEFGADRNVNNYSDYSPVLTLHLIGT